MLTSFFSRPLVRIVGSYLIVLCIGAGLGVYGHIRWQTPPEGVVRVVENIKYVDVPVDKIVVKNIPVFIRDQVEVKKLLTEAAAAKNEIRTLTETIAILRTTTVAPPETRTVFVETPGAPEAHFKDWRLTFDATPAQTVYQLNQRFESIAAIGRDRAGKPVVQTKLFEIGPGELRTPLTEASTIVVSATPNPRRWFLNGAVQAGLGYTRDIAAGTNSSGGVVGLQWVKRGTSKAAEDGSFSLLTPVAFISSGILEFGVLPGSVNLGRIPKQPFKDLWVSPLLTFGKAQTAPTRFGFVFTATF